MNFFPTETLTTQLIPYTGFEALDEEVLEEVLEVMVDRERQNRLAATFTTIARRNISLLKQAAANGDGKTFLNRTHAIKGSASTLGMHGVVSRCDLIEALEYPVATSTMIQHAQQLDASVELACDQMLDYLRWRRQGH